MDMAPTDSDQAGEKPPRPLQAMKGEVLATTLSIPQAWQQSVYVINSMGGRARESVKKGYISSWKPWEWKKDGHHFQCPYIHI